MDYRISVGWAVVAAVMIAVAFDQLKRGQYLFGAISLLLAFAAVAWIVIGLLRRR